MARPDRRSGHPARRPATAARRISPRCQRLPWAKTRSRTARASARARAWSPSRRAASARAARTGPRRISWPLRSASASASSSVASASGSPRRARTWPKRRQRHDPRHGRQHRLPEQLADLRLRRVPVAQAGSDRRPRRQEIPAVEVEIVLGRVGDAGREPAIGLVEPHDRQRAPGQNASKPGRRGRRTRCQARGRRLRVRSSSPRVIPGVKARRTDVRQRVDERFRLPKLLGEGDRPLAPQERLPRGRGRASAIGRDCCRPWPAPARAAASPAGPARRSPPLPPRRRGPANQ